MNQIQNPKATAQTGPDASERRKLKKYQVELGFTQYSSATIIVEAASLAEARDKADEIETEEIDFNPTDGDMTVLDISPLDEDDSKSEHEGGAHE